MNKTLLIFTLIFFFIANNLFANHIVFRSSQDESSGYLEQTLLDKYEKDISLLSSQKYHDLQLIIVSKQDDKGGTIMVSILIEPNGWRTFSSNTAQLKLDDKIYDEAKYVIIGPFYMGREYQEFNFVYSHKNFKEFIKSNKLNLKVLDFEILINLNKLHLEKFELQ